MGDTAPSELTKARLTVVVPEAVPTFGSHELDLVRRLRARGWQATLMTTRGRGRYRLAAGLPGGSGVEEKPQEVRRLPSREVFGISLPSGVGSLLEELDPELLHLHSEEQPLSLAVTRWARRRQVPLLVASERYAPPFRLASRLLYELVARQVSRSVLRAACAWTAHTTAAEAYLSRWGLGNAPISVIPTAVDCSQLRSGRAAEGRVHLGTNEGSPVILSVGRLVPQKGYDDLVEAANHLVKARPDVQIRVLGRGPAKRSLERRIERLGLGSAFKIASQWVPPTEMPHLYAAADVYVQPSRFEPFGRALVEALAAGCPAVATCLGGFLDTVPPDAGRLIESGKPRELASAILELLSNASPALRAQAGSWARERFDWAVVLPKYEALYAQCLRGGEMG